MGVSKLKYVAEVRKFNNRSVRRETKNLLKEYAKDISPWPQIYVMTTEPPKFPSHNKTILKADRS